MTIKMTKKLATIKRTFATILLIALMSTLVTSCGTLGSGSYNLANLPDHYSQVALLLPLHGRYSGPGKAVQDGFLAGYYAQLQANRTTDQANSSNNSTQNNIKIRVYDTSKTKDIRKLYADAVAEGANIVIGPLSKSNVKLLGKRGNISVPTIALNYINQNSNFSSFNPPPLFFQFGISPENEAIQVANRALAAGLSHALIIAPLSNWAQNIVKIFTAQWEASNGTIVDSLYYQPNQNFRSTLRKLLNVDQSMTRTRNLQRILREKIVSVPQRRKDIDMIFLIAPPRVARQINPLLKFYYAGNIPTYSISMIYKGVPRQSYYRDMNGIIFSDIPWIFNTSKTAPLQKRIAKLWPRGYQNYIRLYALGLDAFMLTQNLKSLPSQPQPSFVGRTGQLYLSQQPNQRQQITQKFIWAKFIKGRATLLRS